MFLTAPNLAHYLLGRGLITARVVVDGDFVVADVGRRNRNFKVLSATSPGLFIKQIREPSPGAIETLRREAAVYQIVQAPRWKGLRGLLPRFLAWDPERKILTLELVKDGLSALTLLQRSPTFPVEPARNIGRALGRWHREGAELINEGAGGEFVHTLPHLRPWILTLARQADLAGGPARAIVSFILAHPRLRAQLDELHTNWRPDCLIHGDVKLDNVLVIEPPADPEAKRDRYGVRVVDWELADIGDSTWDLGGALQSFLSHWILSAPPERRSSTPDPGRLDAMYPALRAFWRCYVAARGLAPEAATALLERSVRCAAARMIQTCYEACAANSQLHEPAAALLRVSANMLDRPTSACRDLLGLTP